jgi:hypothetical protein
MIHLVSDFVESPSLPRILFQTSGNRVWWFCEASNGGWTMREWCAESCTWHVNAGGDHGGGHWWNRVLTASYTCNCPLQLGCPSHSFHRSLWIRLGANRYLLCYLPKSQQGSHVMSAFPKFDLWLGHPVSCFRSFVTVVAMACGRWSSFSAKWAFMETSLDHGSGYNGSRCDMFWRGNHIILQLI